MENVYMKNQTHSLRLVKRAAMVGLVGNAGLTILKVVLGLVFFNMAVLSDAAHSAMDAVTTLLVILAASVSKPTRDKEHNYGHEKRESLIVLFLSLFMFATAVLLVVQGVRGLISVTESEFNLWLVGVVVVSILVKEALFHYTNHYAKKTRSAALRADAWGHRLDCVTSVAVLVGLVLTIWIGTDLAESIAVLVVALFIVRIAYKVFRGAYNQLVDKAADKKDLDKIMEIAEGVEGVQSVDSLNTRLFGSAILVDMEISVCGEMTVDASHDIAQQVHDLLEGDTNLRIKHCNVHVNPAKI